MFATLSTYASIKLGYFVSTTIPISDRFTQVLAHFWVKCNDSFFCKIRSTSKYAFKQFLSSDIVNVQLS